MGKYVSQYIWLNVVLYTSFFFCCFFNDLLQLSLSFLVFLCQFLNAKAECVCSLRWIYSTVYASYEWSKVLRHLAQKINFIIAWPATNANIIINFIYFFRENVMPPIPETEGIMFRKKLCWVLFLHSKGIITYRLVASCLGNFFYHFLLLVYLKKQKNPFYCLFMT